ncbi:SigE family RNA polymerase sigma factor [Nonomuraea sp. NPDC000554]|uniref:SigE family RNA polymerase sigma factor n=1 Tax=Nonomuraea sp. NPDC000554 TaxID=3154259 RepID=UPI00332B4C7F
MRPWGVEFEEFVRARSHALLRYGLVLTGSADDAADLVQEALLRLSASWRRVRNKDDPEGYVRTIMARQHVSWWRRRQREHLTAEVPSPVHEDEHELGEIWQRLRALPARQRAVLVLRHCEDLADGEIAAAEDRDVLPGMTAKRRRRVRRRAKGTLAAVCAVVLGWGVLLAWPAQRVVVNAAEPGRNSVERVWPQAVFTMLGRSRPLAAISATEVLVWAERGTIEVYDSASKRSRVVAALTQAPQHLAVDGERVLWLADGYAWVAPLRTSGKARKAGPITAEDIDRIALVGQYVVWSSPLDGVWRMRIDGGAPERVAKSKGLQLVEWPWATDEPLDMRTNPTRIVNLQTGRTIKIRPAPGAEGLRCGPTWCTGTRGEDAIVQRSDGSWNRVHRGLPGYPYHDRFFIGFGEIYDARTDTTVTFEGAKLGSSGGNQWSQGSGVIFWTQGGGVRVVNLAAVPQP